MMRARNGLDPVSLTDEDAILYRSAEWGIAGERMDVGYIYPTAASQGIASTVVITDKVRIRIALKSGAAVANTIDGTTEWDITVTPDTPVVGVEEVTYTYNGTGTTPGMGTLAAGDYVTINANGDFNAANIGTFRVSSAIATSFTIRRTDGEAVAEINVATLTTNTISLYEDDDTTAAEIVTFVTANLSEWISSSLLDDNGTTGAGIINLSTHEDNDFASGTESVSLLDGINWLASSDLGVAAPNPQFTLKETLDLPSFSTNTVDAYAFNDGEAIRIIPTTTAHVASFISILAVSGLTTLGDVSTSDRDRNLQLSTQILGSEGSVRVSGGRANAASASVVGTASQIANSDLMKISIDTAAASGMNASQWVKVSATNKQKKVTGISVATAVTITPNEPTATESIIALEVRDTTDRYYGQPRNHFRSRGRAFQVENQGSLVAVSWDEVTGADPLFAKSAVIFNDDGADMSVNFNGDFNSTEYVVETGVRIFSEVSIGDSATFINFADAVNNGTFIVNGISDDGTILSVNNPNGVSAVTATVAALDIVISTAIEEGDTIEIGSSFSTLNQGQFRVIRRYLNTIYIDNPSAVEERVV